MHVSDPSAFAFYDQAIEALESCNMMAAEIDLDHSSSFSMNDLLHSKEGDLDDLMSPKQYIKLRKTILKYYSFDIDPYKRFVPLFLINLISELDMKSDNRKSLDAMIWQQAIRLNIQRTGLEDFYEHYKVLQKIPVDYQVAQLRKMVKNIPRIRRNIKTVKKLYEQGDVHLLYKIIKHSLGKMRKVMLYERNDIIANKIIKLSQSHRLFAAMGVSHLGGQKGVVRLLKQSNFEVKPV